ncbi:MAG: hypothetical protein R6V84_02615 [Desulfobacterales bacterium]
MADLEILAEEAQQVAVREKIVPDPNSPTRGLSSPKWGVKPDTRAKRPVRHIPSSPAIRSTRQVRGQRVHSESRASALSLCRRKRPLRWLRI